MNYLLGTILCRLGIHDWQVTMARMTLAEERYRIPGTGFDYQYQCYRCGKTEIRHEGGSF